MISLMNKQRGDVIEYWYGPTDFEPEGERKEVFDYARKLYEKGRVFLTQEWVDAGEYSYRMIVK